MDEGYAKIAQLMHRNPEYRVIRKFERLQIEDLLLLQAQLTELEIELRDIVADDVVAQTHEAQRYHADWWYLSRSSEFGNEKQLQKRLEIRRKLREYGVSYLVSLSSLSLTFLKT